MKYTASAKTFSISHTALENIFQSYAYLMPVNEILLIAIRAALPESQPKGWVHSVQLKKSKLNYRHLRCSVGLWDQKQEKVFFAPGSTVPYWKEIEKAALKNGTGTNQVEAGFYHHAFRKGEHLMGKPRGHEALRQEKSLFIRRNPRGGPFKESDPLFFSNPHDNIHCGWNESLKKEGYSSAGCLVVAGTPFCKRLKNIPVNQGPWKIFHDLIYSCKQREFSLALFRAEEVFRTKARSGFDSLTYGSKGDRVKDLQRKLKLEGLYKGAINGRLDSKTFKSLASSRY